MSSTGMFRIIQKLDSRFVKAVAAYRAGPVTLIFRLLTYSAVGPAWFGCATLLMILEKTGFTVFREQALLLRGLFAPLAVWIIGHVIKRICRRKRPFQFHQDFSALVKSPIDDSFPSLHAGSTFAFFAALAIYRHPWAALIALWALLTSFSRIYLGVHYLTDIVGGVILGFTCGSLIGTYF